MNILKTTVHPVGLQAKITMLYNGRTRVRYMNVNNPLTIIAEHERQFLKDMHVHGNVLRKGRIV